MMVNEKEILLLDVDHVICFPGYLQAVNEFLGTHYEIDDVTDYFIDRQFIPKELFSDFNAFINDKNLYEEAQLLPGAKESIQRLNAYYSILICSSCINPFNISGSGKLFMDKYDFLQEHLSFIDPKNYIFTGVKNIFQAFAQVDDLASNMENKIPIRILFPSYHNKNIHDEILNEKGLHRAGYDWREGWKEVESILLSDKVLVMHKKR